MNIIRHLISKNGLDPFLESSLLLDAPELLQETKDVPRKANVSHKPTGYMSNVSVEQSVPGNADPCAIDGVRDVAGEATATENSFQVDPSLAPLPFEQIPFADGWSDEQFDEMVRSMKADGTYPLSVADPSPDVSLDGWEL